MSGGTAELLMTLLYEVNGLESRKEMNCYDKGKLSAIYLLLIKDCGDLLTLQPLCEPFQQVCVINLVCFHIL